MIRLLTCLITYLVSVIIISGCSSTRSLPIVPPEAKPDFLVDISAFDDSAGNHNLLGIWTTTFDVELLEATVEPNRTLNAHHNVTAMMPSPTIVFRNWDPVEEVADVDITLHNTTAINAYDIRFIIFTDAAGHTLMNADDWTPLWDIPEGLIANPFKAYAKYEPNRVFSGMNWHIESFQIKCPNSNGNVQFAIEASYPGNCEEPYEITDFLQGILYDEVGSSTEVEVSVLDWQDDVNAVNLFCPDIMGANLVPFTNSINNIWETTVVNNLGVSAGTYNGYIQATSSNSGSLALYSEVKIIVCQYSSGWARSWGYQGNSYGWVYDVATDMSDNCYTTGYFYPRADFDPGPGEDIHESSGKGNAFLSKIDSDGNFQWARTWGGTKYGESDEGYAVTCDNLGNIYVTGIFWLEVDFDPGPGEDIHDSNGASDAFLCKYDSSGNYLWALTWGGNYAGDVGLSITSDDENNIYISGAFDGTADFDPGIGEDIHESDNTDCFMSVFDVDGNFKWAQTWGDNGFEMGYSIALDISNNVYVTGKFRGSTDFDPGPGLDIHDSNGYHDIFLSKLDNNGNFIFAKTWGGIAGEQNWDEIGNDVYADSNSDVYVTGCFCDTVDFDPGPGVDEHTSNGDMDIFLSKFDSFGNLLWALTWGGYNGYGSSDTGYCVLVDDWYNVYVSGRYNSHVDFDPGPGEEIHGIEGYRDIFLSKFTIDGEFCWVRTWLNESFQDKHRFHGISVDNSGSILLAGGYQGNTDFDPGTGVDEHPDNGMYLMKLLPSGYWE